MFTDNTDIIIGSSILILLLFWFWWCIRHPKKHKRMLSDWDLTDHERKIIDALNAKANEFGYSRGEMTDEKLADVIYGVDQDIRDGKTEPLKG